MYGMRRAALCSDNAPQFPKSRATFQQFKGSRVPGATAKSRIIFQDSCSEMERLFPQILRSVRPIFKDRHHILNFEQGAYTAPDRLPAFGGDDFYGDAEMISH